MRRRVGACASRPQPFAVLVGWVGLVAWDAVDGLVVGLVLGKRLGVELCQGMAEGAAIAGRKVRSLAPGDIGSWGTVSARKAGGVGQESSGFDVIAGPL